MINTVIPSVQQNTCLIQKNLRFKVTIENVLKQDWRIVYKAQSALGSVLRLGELTKNCKLFLNL